MAHRPLPGYNAHFKSRLLYQMRGVIDGTTNLATLILVSSRVLRIACLHSPLFTAFFPILKLVMLFPFLGSVIRIRYLNESNNKELQSKKGLFARYPATIQTAVLIGLLGGSFLGAIAAGIFISSSVGLGLTLGVLMFDAGLEIFGILAHQKEIKELKKQNAILLEELVMALREDKPYQQKIIDCIKANEDAIKARQNVIHCQSAYIVASDGVAFAAVTLILLSLAFPAVSFPLIVAGLTLSTFSSIAGVYHTFAKKKVDLALNDALLNEEDADKAYIDALIHEAESAHGQKDTLSANEKIPPSDTHEKSTGSELDTDNEELENVKKTDDACSPSKSGHSMFTKDQRSSSDNNNTSKELETSNASKLAG